MKQRPQTAPMESPQGYRVAEVARPRGRVAARLLAGGAADFQDASPDIDTESDGEGIKFFL